MTTVTGTVILFNDTLHPDGYQTFIAETVIRKNKSQLLQVKGGTPGFSSSSTV
jgi:hypothetical protein